MAFDKTCGHEIERLFRDHLIKICTDQQDMQLIVRFYVKKASDENIVIVWVDEKDTSCNFEYGWDVDEKLTITCIEQQKSLWLSEEGTTFWPRNHETTRLGVGLGIFDKRS